MRIASLIAAQQVDLAAGGNHRPRPSALSTELLIARRRARNPLPTWVRNILDRFAQARAQAGADLYSACQQLLGCFNEAALVELHFGRRDHAGTLCRAAINLVERVLSKTGRLSAARFAFQPFINEGRLDRMSSHWDDALDKFRRLKSFREGESVEIGRLRITPRHSSAIATESPDFAGLMYEYYVIESLTTLLRAERFAEAIHFVTVNEPAAAGWLAEFLQEAAIVTLIHLGMPETALEIADTYLRDPSRQNRAIFSYRRAEILVARNQSEEALKILERLGGVCLSPNLRRDRMNLNLLARLGRQLTGLRSELATPVVRIGLACSEHQNDILSQHEFLMLLLRISLDSMERSAIEMRTKTLLQDNGYGMAQSPGASSLAGKSLELIDELYQTLNAVVSGI
jgi:hypothetical protein